MLPGQCAQCKGLREVTPDPYEGLLIQRFYLSARHQQTCAMSRRGLQDHDIMWGEQFALAVHDNATLTRLGYVCDECTNAIARPGTSVQ